MRRPSGRLTWAALLVGLGGSFHFGYQITLTNPAQQALTQFVAHSFQKHYGQGLEGSRLDALWGFIIALLFAGGILGSIVLRQIADRWGRKNGLLASFCGILLSSAIFELYAISRFVMGVCMCVALGLCGLFLAECSPKECRGMVCMTTGIFVQCGLFAGSLIGMPDVFGTEEEWWMIYLVEIVIVCLVMAFFSFCLETPGYLIFKGYEEAARASAKHYHGCPDHALDKCVREIWQNVDADGRSMGMLQVLAEPRTRRAALVGATAAFAMAFSGVAVINAFAVQILRDTGLSSFQASLANAALSFLTLVGALLSASVIDKFGRRALLLSTVALITVTNVGIFGFMHAYSEHASSWMGYSLIGIIALFLVAFTVGPGPMCYFITSELTGQRARSAAQSWASFVQMSSRFVILVSYLPLSNAIGSDFAYLVLFVAPMAYCFVFFYYLLPETKHRNLLEVEEEITRLPRLPCKAVRVYDTVCAQRDYDSRDPRQVF